MESDSDKPRRRQPLGIDEAPARERNLLRTLIDNLPDFVYAKDLESHFTLSNRAHARSKGLASPDQVIGKTDLDFNPEDIAQHYIADDREVMRTGMPLVDREETTIDKQGRTRWLLTTKVPIHDESGAISGIIGISRDITALKEAEQALARRAERQSLIATTSARFIDVPLEEIDDAIQDALGVFGSYAKVDRSYALLYRKDGVTLDEQYEWCAEGMPPQRARRQALRARETLPWLAEQLRMPGAFTFSDIADLPEEAAAERTYLAAHGVKSLILLPMTSEGRRIGFLGFEQVASARIWENRDRELIEALGRILVHSLSRRMHMEALDRERSFMHALMDNLPDSVYFKDQDSRFIRISKGFIQKHGVGPEEALGKSDFDLFTGEHAQQAFEDEQRIIRTGEPMVSVIEKETWADRPPTWVATTKMPFRNSKGEIIGTFGISRDVTAQKQMEDALAEHAALLEEANEELKLRNQDLDEFSYIASHDLQEPLRKLIAFSDMLREDLQGGTKDDIAHDLEVLSSAAQRMRTLVQDLLALSRSGRQSMHIESLELDEIIDLALDALEIRIHEEHAEISRTPMPLIEGDKTLLTQLYQNLIGNALKFHGDATPHIELTAERREDGGWVFGVRDNGIGFKQEYAEQIFSPFKRLHGRTAYEGTGIGLAICRKIVERHDGKIWVDSRPGEGAHFHFTLGAMPQPREFP